MTLGEAVESLIKFAHAPPQVPVSDFFPIAMMNWFGCAVAGASVRAVDLTAAAHAADGGGALLPPIGRNEHLSASATVLVDCLSSASQAYDDIHFETTLHPAGPVAAAIFGLARIERVEGARALQALRLGMEVECRMSRLMMGADTGSASGWYPTGITGGFGAAAATGWLLGLDLNQMRHAFGIAASRASGTRGTHGGMTAFYVPAVAAEAGYIAARLAQQGFTSGPGAVSGALGLVSQIASKPAIRAATEGLGQSFQSEATACKPYPYGFISFALIECCVGLVAQTERVAMARKVVIEVSATAARLGANAAPKTMFEAQVSLPYIAAVTLFDPAAVLYPLRDDFAISPGLSEFMAKITVQPAADLADHQARAVLTTSEGQTVCANCDAAIGSAGRLPDTESLQRKFLNLTRPVLGEKSAPELMRDLMAIKDCSDLKLLLMRAQIG